jgi:hypothetical protein
MSAGAAPFSGQARTSRKAVFEFQQRAASGRPFHALRVARSAVEQLK